MYVYSTIYALCVHTWQYHRTLIHLPVVRSQRRWSRSQRVSLPAKRHKDAVQRLRNICGDGIVILNLRKVTADYVQIYSDVRYVIRMLDFRMYRSSF